MSCYITNKIYFLVSSPIPVTPKCLLLCSRKSKGTKCRGEEREREARKSEERNRGGRTNPSSCPLPVVIERATFLVYAQIISEG